MRRTLIAAALCCTFASSARADVADAGSGKHDHHPQVSSQQCGLSTPFNVLADSGGIWLYRDSGSPREIFFHAGELSVDHKVRGVSDADAQRLREMEADTRALMPQVADVARDVVNITYDAFGGVIAAMTGSDAPPRRIERDRKRALDYVGGTLGVGRWDQDAFDGNFEKYVEDEAEKFKGSILRHTLWTMVTGGSEAMDARMDTFGDALDARLDAQTGAIEAKANALCTEVEKLRQLQGALDFRYNGQPLTLLTPVQEGQAGSGIDVVADPPGTTSNGTGDTPADTSIKPRPVAKPATPQK